MLKNAYFLAKIGADTAENERNFANNLPNIATPVETPNCMAATAAELENSRVRFLGGT